MKWRFWIWLRKSIRWSFANLLDKLYPDACWTRLALWSMYLDLHEWGEWRDLIRPDGRCRRDADKDGSCYCGKMRKEVAS